MILQSVDEVVEQMDMNKHKFAQHYIDVLEVLDRLKGINDAMYIRIQQLEGHDERVEH